MVDKKSLVDNIAVSALTGFCICIVVPMQTYIGNQDMFDFGICAVLKESLLAFLVVSLILFALLTTARRCFGEWLRVLIVSLCVCVYLETGILSIGVPPLNGVDVYRNLFRRMFDSAVWLLVIAAFFVLRRFVISNVRWIVLSLMILMIASIVDSKSSRAISDEASSMLLTLENAPSEHLKINVYNDVCWSTNRNVLVFVLDMTPATVVSDVIDVEPVRKQYFPGFTAFRKNIGMHHATHLGIPGMLTGKYCEDENDSLSYRMTMFGEDSFLIDYVRSGFAFYYSDSLLSYGLTNKCLDEHQEVLGQSKDSLRDNELGFAFLRNGKSTPYLSLWTTVCFRVVPYRFKSAVFRKGIAQVSTTQCAGNPTLEESVYPILSAATNRTDGCNVFGFFHTVGVHPPIDKDKYGRLFPSPRSDKEAICEAAVYKLDLLKDLFTVLRENGVYDNSTIIVTTDHGSDLMRSGKNDGPESALLWIKPHGAQNEFCFSDAPTTHAKFAEMMKRLAVKELTIEEMADILSQDVRIYRGGWSGQVRSQFYGKIHFKDWIYDKNNALIRIEQH